jgi:hypothetical protein
MATLSNFGRATLQLRNWCTGVERELLLRVQAPTRSSVLTRQPTPDRAMPPGLVMSMTQLPPRLPTTLSWVLRDPLFCSVKGWMETNCQDLCETLYVRT